MYTTNTVQHDATSIVPTFEVQDMYVYRYVFILFIKSIYSQHITSNRLAITRYMVANSARGQLKKEKEISVPVCA